MPNKPRILVLTWATCALCIFALGAMIHWLQYLALSGAMAIHAFALAAIAMYFHRRDKLAANETREIFKEVVRTTAINATIEAQAASYLQRRFSAVSISTSNWT